MVVHVVWLHRSRRRDSVRELTHFIGGEHIAGTSGRFADVFEPVDRRRAGPGPPSPPPPRSRPRSRTPKRPSGNGRHGTRSAAPACSCASSTSSPATPKTSHACCRRSTARPSPTREGDIQRGVEVIEFAVGGPHLLKGEFTTEAGGGIDVYSMRQPLGVVAGITPFNFPAMIPMWKIGAPPWPPAMRGAPPPACSTSSTATRLNVVNGDKEAVDAILHDDRVRAVGFVGSTPIARYIYATAAAEGKRAQCFGGAKNHMIVMPDADLDQVADALVGAGYGSAGERCMAISVAVPVGEQTADALAAKLTERVRALRVGAATDPRADYGPLVTRDAVERVTRSIGVGVEEGAELLVDGRGHAVEGYENGFYLGPTLFDRVTPEMTIYREEIFGPVLIIARAADYEEALALPSTHEFGNGVSIFTRDGDTARDFTARVDVGMVGVNVPIPVPIAYHTFGGWKKSGFGDLNQHGPDAFRFYTKTKTVTSRWPSGIKEGASFVIPTMHEA
ncbi:hypothetical protein LUZ63_023705 [Rhynchospora breviuscula]|uniref:methylmalonate-semialdehyde dehydrogenase (CoA acylating) n=1 Tax=Rhynchospora breviuscula TaxID=2022672 RepID=A0A9P9Z3H2_9POAL|nr:hypothetical protein LUZ63_023705 [Rhynchospora breviuscula]